MRRVRRMPIMTDAPALLRTVRLFHRSVRPIWPNRRDNLRKIPSGLILVDGRFSAAPFEQVAQGFRKAHDLESAVLTHELDVRLAAILHKTHVRLHAVGGAVKSLV